MNYQIYFSDFDGTLTHGHSLKSLFFDILQEIKSANGELIIVSGRSVSWGHFFISHLPMPYSIMEGGGVIIYKNEKTGLLEEEVMVSQDELLRLEDACQKIFKEFPMLSLSVDSQGRKTDRAIELRILEDDSVMSEVKSLLSSLKVNFSTSNVHLNFWCGEINKYKTVDYFLKKYYPEIDMNECVFFGDSLNDESMFEHFPNTVGVSNIAQVIDRLDHRPKVILDGPINEGPYGVLNFLQNKI